MFSVSVRNRGTVSTTSSFFFYVSNRFRFLLSDATRNSEKRSVFVARARAKGLRANERRKGSFLSIGEHRSLSLSLPPSPRSHGSFPRSRMQIDRATFNRFNATGHPCMKSELLESPLAARLGIDRETSCIRSTSSRRAKIDRRSVAGRSARRRLINFHLRS